MYNSGIGVYTFPDTPVSLTFLHYSQFTPVLTPWDLDTVILNTGIFFFFSVVSYEDVYMCRFSSALLCLSTTDRCSGLQSGVVFDWDDLERETEVRRS